MDNKSLRFLGLLPNKIGKIKVRQLVVGEVVENTYSILSKDQIFSPLQSRRKGCRRNKRSRLPLPWRLVKGKAGLSIGYGWFQSLRGCSAVVRSVDFSSCLCSPCSDTDRPSWLPLNMTQLEVASVCVCVYVCACRRGEGLARQFWISKSNLWHLKSWNISIIFLAIWALWRLMSSCSQL